MSGPTADDLARAVAVLRSGGLVAFPTETVYGLGADAAHPAAVRHLYAVKGRPAGHPVIAHLAAAEQLDAVAADVSPVARDLAAACWPGPLTLVVRRRPGAVADEVTGGRDTVGVRVPDHPVATALLAAFGGPVAAPSANRFGRVSPTTADHVHADLDGDVDVILDGGPCRVGVESTIVDVTGPAPVVLRVGGVSEETLRAVVGSALPRLVDGEVAAPGTLASHYAPRAEVVLVAPGEESGVAARLRTEGRTVAVLTTTTDAHVDAHDLYARLRAADDAGVDTIVAVLPADDNTLAAAVRDRLWRAAGG